MSVMRCYVQGMLTNEKQREPVCWQCRFNFMHSNFMHSFTCQPLGINQQWWLHSGLSIPTIGLADHGSGGLVGKPAILLSGKPRAAVICQTMAENEPSRNHMPSIHMSTPAGKGLSPHP
jgi:hypothetical protein